MALRVLILCTANSARSQMAEGLMRTLSREQIEVESAGAEPSSVNPLAIEVMAEQGIDISRQRSKHLNEFLATPFDYVITVCDNAAQRCPMFPGLARRIHWSIADPAAVQGNAEQRRDAFRGARDDLRSRIIAWLPGILLNEEQRSTARQR